MKDNIVVTTKDLINEVANKLGFDKRIVEGVVSSNIEYIRHLAKQDDVYNIKLPFVGNLYYYARAHQRMQHLKKKGSGWPKYLDWDYENGFKKLSHLLELQRVRREDGTIKPKSVLKHFRKKLTKTLRNSGYMDIDEVEKIQNDYYTEWKK